MSKFISIEEAVSKVKDGMTIMVGGFLANGTPNKIVDALAKSGVKNLPGQRSRSIDCQQTSKETFRVTHRDQPAHERTNE